MHAIGQKSSPAEFVARSGSRRPVFAVLCVLVFGLGAMTDNLIEATPSAYAYPLLIKHILDAPRAYAASQQIVYRDLRRYSYSTLRERVSRLASALVQLGVQPADTVAVMDWDSDRYLECFFAVPMMGAVLQTVNVRLSPEQILYTLNHAGAKIVLVNGDFLACLNQIKDKLETVRQFVLITDGARPSEQGIAFISEYERLLESGASNYEFPDFDENTRATTFYTTGTTGLPKGVYFSHRQIVLHTLALLAAFGLQPGQGRLSRDDVYMPITPMFHVHAWGFPFAATMAGMKQVYPGHYVPQELLALKHKECVTFSHCVPTILQMLLSNPAAKDVDLRGWKIIIGGSALPTSLVRQALERGIDVFAGYGMSETCPVLTIAHLKSSGLDTDETITLRAKSGLPIPLVTLRIVDEEMRDLEHDGKASGEVVARTPWLTQGYLHNSSASEQLWAGGYLHTGDIGTIGEDGYLQITDRIKDVIKSGGEWISSVALEDIILQHPGVSEAAVIGMPDAKWAERPLALVVPKRDFAGILCAADIQTHMQKFVDDGVISRLAVPQKMLFVDVLERTSVGKLNKKAMRERYCGTGSR
jgi:fatty-acyl-CoA synthase